MRLFGSISTLCVVQAQSKLTTFLVTRSFFLQRRIFKSFFSTFFLATNFPKKKVFFSCQFFSVTKAQIYLHWLDWIASLSTWKSKEKRKLAKNRKNYENLWSCTILSILWRLASVKYNPRFLAVLNSCIAAAENFLDHHKVENQARGGHFYLFLVVKDRQSTCFWQGHAHKKRT